MLFLNHSLSSPQSPTTQRESAWGRRQSRKPGDSWEAFKIFTFNETRKCQKVVWEEVGGSETISQFDLFSLQFESCYLNISVQSGGALLLARL